MGFALAVSAEYPYDTLIASLTRERDVLSGTRRSRRTEARTPVTPTAWRSSGASGGGVAGDGRVRERRDVSDQRALRHGGRELPRGRGQAARVLRGLGQPGLRRADAVLRGAGRHNVAVLRHRAVGAGRVLQPAASLGIRGADGSSGSGRTRRCSRRSCSTRSWSWRGRISRRRIWSTRWARTWERRPRSSRRWSPRSKAARWKKASIRGCARRCWSTRACTDGRRRPGRGGSPVRQGARPVRVGRSVRRRRPGGERGALQPGAAPFALERTRPAALGDRRLRGVSRGQQLVAGVVVAGVRRVRKTEPGFRRRAAAAQGARRGGHGAAAARDGRAAGQRRESDARRADDDRRGVAGPRRANQPGARHQRASAARISPRASTCGPTTAC